MDIAEDQRECPFCAELIKKKAIKCRYCKEDLSADPETAAATGGAPPSNAVTPAPRDDERECPFCAEWIKKKAIKCRHCGERIDATVPGPVPADPAGAARSSVLLAPGLSVKPPRALRERIQAAAGDLPTDERRIVTIVFIDLVGFTALSHERDPDEVQIILNECVQKVSECVYRYEGTVDKFLGDGVLAIFGAPIAHEDDPQRAIDCCLAIQKEIGTLPIVRENNLSYRVGINTGVVLAGRLGSDLRMEYTVIGDTVNIASRLQNHCRPGQVLASESTHARARLSFEFDAGQFYELKGIPNPVKAYTVQRRRSQPPSHARPVDLELVGRHVEHQMILLCVDRLMASQGQVVGIAGDAGLGKTRLVREVQRELQQRGIAWYQGNCLSYGQNFFYLPFQEILRGFFGGAETQTVEQARRRIEDRLGPDVALSPGDTDLLLGLFGYPRTTDKPLSEQAPEQLAFLLERIFLSETKRGPLALFFEDVHWIDQSSLRILDHLAGRIKKAPVLLCCTHRSGFSHGWTSQTYFTQIGLQELSREEGLQLIDQILLRSRIRPDCLDLIIQKSGGNPFFLCELIHQLVANETLRKIDGVYQITRSVDEIPIPESVHAVIAARMDALDEFARAVLQVAAVAGRTFSLPLLQAILGRDRPIREALDRLREMEFIEDGDEAGRPAFVFKHGLTQEVAYKGLVSRHRTRYHHEVATAIESLYADALPEWYERLAHHYLAADDKTQAMAYLKRSGEKAAALYAADEALGFFERYLEIARATDAAKRSARDLCDVQVAMGDVYLLTGNPDEALAAYKAASDSAQTAASQATDPAEFELAEARALRLMGRVHMRRGEYESARLTVDRARQVFAAHNDEQGIAWATNDRGVIAWNLGKLDEALDLFVQARETARRLADLRLQANALSNIGLIHLDRGDLEQSLRANLEALEIRRRRQDPRDVAISLNNLGIVYDSLGEFQKALETYQEALALAREIHYAQGMTHPMTNIGLLYLATGDLTAARRHLDEIHDVAAKAQDRYCHSMLHLILAQVELYQGHFQEALDSFDEALRLTQLSGELQRELVVRVIEARALVRLGQIARAIEILQQAHPLIRQHKFAELETWLCLSFAEACVAKGEPETALEHARKARNLIEGGTALNRRGMCLQVEAFALLGLGRFDEARDAFRQALEFAVGRRDAMTEIFSSIGLARGILERPPSDWTDFDDVLAGLRRRIDEGGFSALHWWLDFLEARRAVRQQQPERARPLLEQAVAQIESLAATLNNPADRQAYLESPDRRAARDLFQTIVHGQPDAHPT